MARDDLEVDVALVGAGGAGLSLVVALDRRAQAVARPAPRVALIDPLQHRADRVAPDRVAPDRVASDRTWCYWTAAPSSERPAAVREWREIEVVDRAGRALVLDLDPLRYVMVPSASFSALAERAAQRLGAVRVRAAAEEVRDGRERAEVRAGGRTIRARYVFDSRSALPTRPVRTAWLQHFRGWTVRFPSECVEPSRAVLMDFRAPQPATVSAGVSGLGFGYVLPLDPCRALVEYTQFSRAPLEEAGYENALRHYLAMRWPRNAERVQVEAVEAGSIPMTDASYPRRTGHRLFRLGTAGGATRASTGYTFAAMQRQAAAVAAALLDGRDPLPPHPYPRRHRWMDAVLLRALDDGLVDGPDLLVRLLERNPPARLLGFLDGITPWRQDLAVMATAPVLPMLRATAVDARARVSARVSARSARVSARRGGRVH